MFGGLEVILSDFNMWGRYLYSFEHFGANNTLYEALRVCLQKFFKHNTSYKGSRSDSKTNYGLGGNFISPKC